MSEEEIMRDEVYENSVQSEQENQSEDILDMVDGTTEENSATEPIVVETKGKWQPFEAMTQETLEVGKTYHIELGGVCEVAVSPDRPTNGIIASSIDYTKDETNRLWIKTGG